MDICAIIKPGPGQERAIGDAGEAGGYEAGPGASSLFLLVAMAPDYDSWRCPLTEAGHLANRTMNSAGLAWYWRQEHAVMREQLRGVNLGDLLRSAPIEAPMDSSNRFSLTLFHPLPRLTVHTLPS